MRKDKIFELKIEEEDDLSGIDSISLVDEPAIEVNWIAFNKEKPHEFHIPEGSDRHYLEKLFQYGQDENELLSDGWEVVKENFISSDPNADSLEDTGQSLIRYKYGLNPLAPGSPIKATTREFCSDLLNKNFVYRVEDLEAIINDEGDSAMVWRGGYNCRHIWQKITYRRGTDIVNKASVTKGREEGPGDNDVLGYPQPDTRVPEWPSFSKTDMGYDNNLPAYVDQISGKTISKSLVTGGTTTLEKEFEYLFDKEKMSKQHFAIDSEEKRIVLGPAMIADQKIFRKDRNGNPYYVFFSAETIRMIAEKYMKNQYTRNNDLMHDGKAVNDIYVVESWIKEDEHDKSVKYGYGDIPLGSWFISMKIPKTPKGDEVWEMVKKGELNGFSVSGYFEEVAQFSKEEMFLYKLAEVLKDIKE